TFGTEPEPDPSCRAEFCESLEDRADRAGDRFIGMKEDFTILVSPNQTNRQAAAQFSASSLVADATVETGANDVQLRFTHRALQTKQQAIVKQRRMVDAVAIADKGVGNAAQLQQAIPVGIVPRQAGDFQAKHDSHVSERHFAGEAEEAGALVRAGA